MRKFATGIVVGVVVLVLLVLTLIVGYGSNWIVTIAVAVVLAAGLTYLALHRRVLVVLFAAAVMFVLSFQYGFGEFDGELWELLVTSSAAMLIAAGTLHDHLRDQRRIGRWGAIFAGLLSAVLSYLAWDSVKIITEHMYPTLLALVGASVVAAVGSAADLAEPRAFPAPEAGAQARLSRRGMLYLLAGWVVLTAGGLFVQSESRSDLAKAEALLGCDVAFEIATSASAPTAVEAIRSLTDLDPLLAVVTVLRPLGSRYGEAAYVATDAYGQRIAVAWFRNDSGGTGGFVLDDLLVCQPYPNWIFTPETKDPFRFEIVVDTEQHTMTVTPEGGEGLYLDKPNPAIFELGVEFEIYVQAGGGPIRIEGFGSDGQPAVDLSLPATIGTIELLHVPDRYVDLTDRLSGNSWSVPTRNRFVVAEPGRYRLAIEAPTGSLGAYVSVSLRIVQKPYPVPFDIEVFPESCRLVDGQYRATGVLTNLDQIPHSYRVFVGFTTGDPQRGVELVEAWTDLGVVAPGAEVDWAVTRTGSIPMLSCEIARLEVSG